MKSTWVLGRVILRYNPSSLWPKQENFKDILVFIENRHPGIGDHVLKNKMWGCRRSSGVRSTSMEWGGPNAP